MLDDGFNDTEILEFFKNNIGININELDEVVQNVIK